MGVQLRLKNTSDVEHTPDNVQVSGSHSSLLNIQVFWAVMTLCCWARGLQCLKGHGVVR